MERPSWTFIFRHLALAGLCLLTVWFGVFDSWENKVLDQRFWLRGQSQISPDLVLVDISTDAAEEFGPWPFPRHIHGMFLDATTNLGVRSVIYDVLFSRPTDLRSDQFLREMTSAAHNVYFPLWFSPYDESFKPDTSLTPGITRHSTPMADGDQALPLQSGLLSLPLQGLDSAARSMGFANVLHDRDGMVRRTPLQVQCAKRVYSQLVVPAWKDRSVPLAPDPALDAQGNLIINWPGKWQDLPHYSFREILISYKQVMEGLDPLLPLDTLRSFKGKIMLVGHVDPASQEFISTPLDPRLPTTGLHFAILNSLLTNSAIQILSPWQECLLVLGILLLAMLLLRQERLRWQIGVGILYFGYLALSQWAFSHYQLQMPAVTVGFALAILMGIHNVGHFHEERQIRMRVKSIFARYVTKEVMEQLLERPELVELGGRKEEVTILFSDIRGFTSLSESLEPREVVDQLNEYLAVMTPIIFFNHGIIDKFVGDEIMAYFGAPVYPKEHAWRAVKVALEMQTALIPLRAKWKAEGRPDMQIGIGINSGNVIMGNIGSAQYMDFTLIGDSVNLAARLCSIAAPDEILISPSSYLEVHDRVIVTRSRETKVKGRSLPVRVYSIASLLPDSPNRRRYERAEASLPIQIRQGPDSHWEEILADIGAGGFRCSQPLDLPGNFEVDVEITLPNGIVVSGASARFFPAPLHASQGVQRAEFLHISKADRSEILKLVQSLAEPEPDTNQDFTAVKP